MSTKGCLKDGFRVNVGESLRVSMY